ncbi:MAG: hypothetical protein ABI085_08850 [Gemmatimonadaceae bacterium]
MRGTREGPKPVANQWIVLHRVGADRAGPLDSTRTTSDGRFSVHYKTSGDTAAVYFVSTSYGGVAYFTSPLRGEVVSGDPATLTVFDTTSGPVKIAIGGRHVVIGEPQANGRRAIAEVYDLQNDSTVTLIARDSVTPVWSTHLPSSAVAFQLNTNGDIAAGAVGRSGNTVQLFAPLSPGIRQFAFTYELPADAFPLAVPVERATGVFELLVQEQTARVHATGTTLREMAPVNPDGRMFRRFLAQDVPANSIVNVDMPRAIGGARDSGYLVVAATLLAVMLAAAFVAFRRGRPRARFAGAQFAGPPFAAPVVETKSQRLLRELAMLDDTFERTGAGDDAARAQYQSERARLKSELSEVLAAERSRT